VFNIGIIKIILKLLFIRSNGFSLKFVIYFLAIDFCSLHFFLNL